MDSLNKGLRASLCDKRKEIEQEHRLHPFWNGVSFSLEEITSQRGLHVKVQPKKCMFFRITKSQMLNICELQVESSSLPVSLPLLWLGTTTRNIYKTTEDPHFPDKEVESLIDNFSERYLVDGCFDGGVNNATGQSHLPSAEFRFSDQYKELCASTLPDHAVLRHGDKLKRYDYNFFTEEIGLDSKTVSISSK